MLHSISFHLLKLYINKNQIITCLKFLAALASIYFAHIRSTKCLFIGYNPYHKGFKCLHPSGRVYIARSVTFNEAEFPYKSLFSKHFPSNRKPCIYTDTSYYQIPTSVSTASQTNNTSTLTITANLPTPTSSLHSSDKTTSPPFIPISDIQVSLPIPPLTTNTHQMITRSKTGTLKPRTFVANILNELEPSSFKEAITNTY